jgi:hypothetical protein
MADKQQQHAAAAATVLGSMPVFSVEQIELIRRLRNSGITKEQMVQVFESLDRLEQELGVMYSIPISLGQFLPQVNLDFVVFMLKVMELWCLPVMIK